MHLQFTNNELSVSDEKETDMLIENDQNLDGVFHVG